jgi:ankyrin repeat protein
MDKVWNVFSFKRWVVKKIKFPFMAVLFLTPFLMTQTGDINSDLMNAAKAGDEAKVEQLLEQGADANAKDEDDVTVLMIAALTGQTDNVRALLAKGADVNAEDKFGWTPFIYAKCAGDTEIMEILKQAGARQ